MEHVISASLIERLKRSLSKKRPAVPHLRAGRDSERGAALMIVVISAALLLVLALAIAMETTLSEKVSHNYRVNVSALYVAEGGVDMTMAFLNSPASFTDSHGTYGGAAPYSGSPAQFFARRTTDPGGFPSFFNSHGLSQFGDTNGDGTVDTDATTPALTYDRDNSSDQAAFLDSLFPDATVFDNIQSLSLFAPPTDPITGESLGVATIRVTAASKNAVRTLEQTFAPTFDKPGGGNLATRALEAGLPAGWNGNPVLVHWGDVLVGDLGIPANANLGNNLDKIVAKDLNANVDNSTLRGNGGNDRWTDILVTGAVTAPASDYEGPADNRPYDGLVWPDETDLDHGNIYQNYVPPLGSTATRLEYFYYRSLAQRSGSYYRSDSSGNIYLNGTGPALNFSTVTDGNSFGVFFVDTTDGNPPASDGSNLANISVNGSYYTQGLFYINANLSFGGLGSAASITALSPPWDPLLPDPTSSTDSSKRIVVNDLGVHVNGLFYVVGNISMGGSPDVFGSLIALGGVSGTGNPEIWFNWELYSGDLSRFDIDPIYKSWRREIYQ